MANVKTLKKKHFAHIQVVFFSFERSVRKLRHWDF